MREKTVIVDINKDYHKSLKYKQYDHNNILNIIIKENNEFIDMTNYTANAFYQLPSKTVIKRNTIKDGTSTIKLTIDNIILSESGRISLEVVINNVDTIVTTFTLFIDVEKSIDRNSAIEGNAEWDVIADGLSALDDITNEISTIEQKITDDSITNIVSQTFYTKEEIDVIKNEVVDARDGETSLKARLDRDIEKAKEVYVNVEGSYISTDSNVGYLRDVEILGNTVQDASDLADIRSVGDKVEGQELYEIPVVSCGKNLFDGELELGGLNDSTGNNMVSSQCIRSVNYIKFDSNKTYVISSDLGYAYQWHWYDKDKNYITQGDNITNRPSNAVYGRFRTSIGQVQNNLNVKIQLEEGTVATPYEPYQEDKLTILSPTPLEKVGDVRDRIIEKDGVWGVEKNVVEFKFSDTSSYTTRGVNSYGLYGYGGNYAFGTSKRAISNKLPFNYSWNSSTPCFYIQDADFVALLNENLTVDEFKLQYSDMIIKYPTTQPQFIPLPHDQQIKLRTFANKTNISFLTEIEGTIKAQVPKSLGATVNTHTEQIRSLNNELNRVKKLEESTVSTVTTESDFTTVEATSNGYFEDLKLEGKTLVNLFKNTLPLTAHWYENTLLQKLKPYTTYTILLNTTCDDVENQIMLGFYRTDKWSCLKEGIPIGYSVFSLTTDDAPTDRILFGSHKSGTMVNYNQILVIEGDHTQNPPSYFEGLKSVGQSATTSEDGADEISVESVKGDGNLFDMNSSTTLDMYLNATTMLPSQGTGNVLFNDYIRVKPNTDYNINIPDTNVARVVGYDINKNPVKILINYTYMNGNKINTFTTDVNIYYVRISFNGVTNGVYNNIQIQIKEGKQIAEYTPHQSDKKRLLYYNEETQAWEKPILREWDSIEKHANGKYYYHQRSGEVVLNGSEEWVLNAGWSGEEMSTNSYYLTADKQKTAGLMVKSNGATNIISEVIPTVFINGASFDGDCISGEIYSGAIYIRINKSKVLNGIKPYLQQNPMRVVYQLAQEKLYECTNIDLITYANETNYIVSSGVIAPRTTLKVHNNISNVVSLLQKKISLLESICLQIFKYMLAGDMISAAYMLYPEDFETTNEEGNIEGVEEDNIEE